MQPSGQAWAQVEQPVQRSSNQRRFVRALTGMGRISSGYWVVNGVRKRVRRVTIIPLAIPVPNKPPPFANASYPQGKCYAVRFVNRKGVVKGFTGGGAVQGHRAQAHRGALISVSDSHLRSSSRVGRHIAQAPWG